MGSLLGAYFDHQPFTYAQFRHPVMSVIWLALLPLCLTFFGCLLTVLLALTIFSDLPLSAFGLAMAAAIISCLSAWIAASARLDEVQRQLKTHLGSQKVHIIAHSLGCFLMGTVIQRFSDIRVGRVILAGSVLSCDFQWMGFRDRFDNVRNEMAISDWVPDIAAWISRFVENLGESGAKGFSGQHVRDACAPETSLGLRGVGATCDCFPSDSSECVQNVHFPSMNHNDWFVGNGHAVRYWLPHLWEIPIKRFLDFVDLCSKCPQIRPNAWKDHQEQAGVIEAERRLGEFCWCWVSARSQSLNEAVREHLEAFCNQRGVLPQADLASLQSMTIHQLGKIVNDAHRYPEKRPLDLHPQLALQKAVKTVVEKAHPRTRAAGF